ncbi:rhamnan synthesis F family protein [Alteromonas flava]|uniref:rhamnan synthesis F family protein n=1 Tax=Alteromonas flava TaxID=2048003 RepID=UPI000C290308|nr:rhamnan synthesis F family protein [Alteromonas flava]
MSAYPFLLCSGFHRSGTSLVSLSMIANGVDMGERLMGPSFSNALGHGEDENLVDIHDNLLAANGTDWRYHGEFDLVLPTNALATLKDYVAHRTASVSSSAVGFGAKDPRAVLFLDAWYQALQDDIRFILIYRDWRLAVSSIMKRHSRLLLQFNQPISQRKDDMAFWAYPDLAARMWLESAKRMADCARKYPEQTLLFEQSAFVAENSRLCQRAQEKGVNASFLASTALEPSLLQAGIPASLLAMISPSLQHECDEAMHMLKSIADVSTHSNLQLRSAHPLTELLLSNYSPQPSQPEQEALALPHTGARKITFKHMSVADAIERMQQLDRSLLACVDWEYLLRLSTCTNNELIELFYLAVKAKVTYAAEIFISRAVIKRDLYWQWAHLGDHYYSMSLIDNAKLCYQKALSSQPDHPGLIAKLADIATAEGDFSAAQRRIVEAQSIDKDHANIKDAQIRLARAQASLSKSDSSLTPITNQFMPINDYETVVAALAQDRAWGQELDKYMVTANFILRDNTNWYDAATQTLNRSSIECFTDYLLSHLDKIFAAPTLLSAFCPETLNERKVPSVSEYMQPNQIVLTKYLIGLHIHVTDPVLLPELIEFVSVLPQSTQIVITSYESCDEFLLGLTQRFKHCQLFKLHREESDINAWLTVARSGLSECDVVLKIHTQPLNPGKLAGWRLLLLWSLAGSAASIERILALFESDPKLGVLLPPYHPAIVDSLNWGRNYLLATAIGERLAIPIPEEVGDFPAGGMFWYRPKALTLLTEHEWSESDFASPVATDGSNEHAIERLICHVVAAAGYNYEFVNPYPGKPIKKQATDS